MFMMIQNDVIIIVRFGVMRVIVFIVDVIGGVAAATVVCVIVAAVAVFAIQLAVVAFDNNAGDMVVMMVIGAAAAANRCRYGRWCDRYDNFLGFDAGNQWLLLLRLLVTFIATEYGQFH